MNILITGGAGYIGSHVCLNLLDRGHNVTVIDDLSTGHKQLIPKQAEFIKASINDTKTLDKLFQNKSFDALMHFAGFIKVEESILKHKKYLENNFNNHEKL